tara:strand:+ start:1187 stop:1516 length:330 start_codon:yes stop_codon:yes gene_type:complete
MDISNLLVSTFESVSIGDSEPYDTFPENLFFIDVLNNRLGINTVDPSYSIHVNDTGDVSGIIYTEDLIINNNFFSNNLILIDTTLLDNSLSLLSYNEFFYDNNNNLKLK